MRDLDEWRQSISCRLPIHSHLAISHRCRRVLAARISQWVFSEKPRATMRSYQRRITLSSMRVRCQTPLCRANSVKNCGRVLEPEGSDDFLLLRNVDSRSRPRTEKQMHDLRNPIASPQSANPIEALPPSLSATTVLSPREPAIVSSVGDDRRWSIALHSLCK
jgi:hypothetical protein